MELLYDNISSCYSWSKNIFCKGLEKQKILADVINRALTIVVVEMLRMIGLDISREAIWDNSALVKFHVGNTLLLACTDASGRNSFSYVSEEYDDRHYIFDFVG